MQFKKRFLMVFMSLSLLAGMLGGGSVTAAGTKITFNDLAVMSDEELAKVPQEVVRTILDTVFKGGANTISKYETSALERVIEQAQVNARQAALDEMSNIDPHAVQGSGDQGFSTRGTGVQLGSDTSVNYAHFGSYGTSGWGSKKAAVDVSNKRGQAYVAIAGYGDPYAYAWTSHTFDVYGSGSQNALITVDTAILYGTVLMGTIKLSLVVEQFGSGYSRAVYPIDEYSAALGQTYLSQQNYTIPFPIQINAGDTYRVAVMVEASCNTFLGAAGADAWGDDLWLFGGYWSSIFLESLLKGEK